MSKCPCGLPVEAEHYELCYNCWSKQDPRNQPKDARIAELEARVTELEAKLEEQDNWY